MSAQAPVAMCVRKPASAAENRWAHAPGSDRRFRELEEDPLPADLRCRYPGGITPAEGDSVVNSILLTSWGSSDAAVGMESTEIVLGNQLSEAPSKIVCACWSQSSSKSRRWGRRPRHMGILLAPSSSNASAIMRLAPHPSHRMDTLAA